MLATPLWWRAQVTDSGWAAHLKAQEKFTCDIEPHPVRSQRVPHGENRPKTFEHLALIRAALSCSAVPVRSFTRSLPEPSTAAELIGYPRMIGVG